MVSLMLYAYFARKGIPHLYNIDTISQWQVDSLVITIYAECLEDGKFPFFYISLQKEQLV